MPIYEYGGKRPTIGQDVFVAANASIIGHVEMGARSSAWFDVTVRADNDRIVIGEESNVQDGCVLHTDEGIELVVGRRATVGHKAMLHGCVVGDGTLIGIGAIILNHARIGERVIVGAGAIVTEGKVIPDGVLVLGSPAKVIRPLTTEELDHLVFAARHYVERAAKFMATLKPV